MLKKYLFLGTILISLTASYLFYRSCKRDTIVINPRERLSVPDSSWLSGSINLDQIRKELAWSTLLNGDLSKLFQTDTNSNILIKIFKSPSDFSIQEQNNIPFFSIWKDSLRYTGIIFQIEHVKAFKKIVRIDSIPLDKKTIYSFRTNEGFWMYNKHSLLFVGQTKNDSAFAASILKNNATSVAGNFSDDPVLATANIYTQYIPDTKIHSLLSHSSLQLFLKNNSKALEIEWNYTGPATALFKQSRLPIANDSTGIFFTCMPSMDSIDTFMQQLPDTFSFNKTKDHPFLNLLFSTLDKNIVSFTFNGWKKIKTSYYNAVMNEEFEMVLQKKDTTFIEPVFEIQIEQSDKYVTQRFLSYLQKQGLISRETNSGFSVIPGNFDSALTLEKENLLVLQNKHHTNKTVKTDSISAAFSLYIKPQFVSGLFDSKINKESLPKIDSSFKRITSFEFLASENNNSLSGSLMLTFNTNQHPIISCIQLLKR